MADPKEKQIEDIVSMLDQFMAGNGGHMNIRVSEDGIVSTDKTMAKSVTTMNSTDCSDGNSACRVPTLFEAMDTEEEDPESNRLFMEDTF
ncbi:hypothetical protein [Lacrimispora saccharolytica]|uniref:Uncharacterized protein n=1 Tax=Lacrimispora saccharolytica (strain ATCC 35040 / DSM 2544 / NRCC 2533 / WM1) TaxID=610130 RepID=D9R2W4_LACSW|nr:hypothetical protein [Lacrimispora saccharolytica]ADL02954.1 hypothetical protein Closa_0316 [[Clostridium] saccharolyticum WM1]QRV18851.1 hypothetical protein I6K70_15305 [Lacrimispora saccharolytica]